MTPIIESFATTQSTPEALQKLFSKRGGLCVSVYLPLHHTPPESEKNPVRLRELIEKVDKKLAANGMDGEARNELLQPLNGLLEHPEELLQPGESIGFFLNHEPPARVEIPYAVEPECHVGNRFLIKPLVRLYQRNPPFVVACLNRGDVRVFRGSRAGLKPVKVPNMPTKLEDITGIDDPEKSVQHHTSKTISAEGRPGNAIAAAFHGQGLPSDLEDTQFVRFFRTLGQSLDKYLNGSNDALIVFGVEQNIGLFKKLHTFSSRTVLYSAHDSHKWPLEKIKSEAWTLLREKAEELQAASLDKISQALGKKEAEVGAEACALAAAMGRIDLAIVATDEQIFGQCDLDNMQVRLIEEGDPLCGNDLLDFIASETIRNGGEVIALPRERIPGNTGVVATTRFPIYDKDTAPQADNSNEEVSQ